MKKTWIITFIIVLIIILAVLLIFLKIGENGKKGEPAAMKDTSAAAEIKGKLERFAPVELTVDPALLGAEDKAVLRELVAAARKIDDIYWKQSAPEGLEIRQRLQASADPADKDRLRYLEINFGPYDRLESNKPFIGDKAKPAGAAFYPTDMTREEFESMIKAYPGLKEGFESPFTVLRRKEGGMEAVPYSEAYRADLEGIAKHLENAAGLTGNATLKSYLKQRAKDLLNNDYYASDCLWIDLKGNRVEIVIGPYEVYEDALMGLKASYESYVYVNDEAEMAKIKGYLDFLGEMQERLPVEKKYRDQAVTGLESPLYVVYEVFTAGDCKAGVQTAAFVLPNDEKVREKKGTKKVFLKNVMEAKFRNSLTPIAERVLDASDAANVSFFAFFQETTLHEISHALGVNYVTMPDGSKVTVNRAMKDLYSAIEEAKADIAGVYQVPYLIEKGWIPADKEKEFSSTYLAGLFRSIRFGAEEAHGKANLIELNYITEKGGFTYDQAAGKYRVDPAKFKAAVESLTRDILMLEGDGDYAKARAFVDKYAVMTDQIKQTIARLVGIPVDIAPIFRPDF